MLRTRLVLFFFFLLVLTGCSNTDQAAASIQDLYCNYTISAEEGGEMVVCKMVFTRGRPSGKTLNIADLGHVELDGRRVEPDSTRKGGVYYEVIRAMQDFEGMHTIVLLGKNGDQAREEFIFRPFGLEALPQTIKSSSLELKLINPPPEDQDLQLIMIDTSFYSSDINETLQPRKGSLLVSADLLSNLEPGPIIMELHQEQTTPLKERTNAGGHLTIFYSLKREFELVP